MECTCVSCAAGNWVLSGQRARATGSLREFAVMSDIHHHSTRSSGFAKMVVVGAMCYRSFDYGRLGAPPVGNRLSQE